MDTRIRRIWCRQFPCRGVERLTEEQRKIKDLEKILEEKELELEILNRRQSSYIRRFVTQQFKYSLITLVSYVFVHDKRLKYAFMDSHKGQYRVEGMVKALGLAIITRRVYVSLSQLIKGRAY